MQKTHVYNMRRKDPASLKKYKKEESHVNLYLDNGNWGNDCGLLFHQRHVKHGGHDI